MGRILFFALLIAVIYLLVRRFSGMARAPRSDPQPPPSQAMVACAHCGTYVPANEAITDGKQHFCCREHQRLAQRQG